MRNIYDTDLATGFIAAARYSCFFPVGTVYLFVQARNIFVRAVEGYSPRFVLARYNRFHVADRCSFVFPLERCAPPFFFGHGTAPPPI